MIHAAAIILFFRILQERVIAEDQLCDPRGDWPIAQLLKVVTSSKWHHRAGMLSI